MIIIIPTFMQLGKQIAEIRRKKGLTQKQLSALASISKDTLSRIESGSNCNPSIFVIRAISKHLDNIEFNIYK